ncbi:MAG: hypothetical protein ACI8PP_003351 [Candidatus Pseudothioglobus sp.]
MREQLARAKADYAVACRHSELIDLSSADNNKKIQPMFLASLNLQQKETFLCLAHNVVVSDGDLTIGEREKMAEMRTEMTISADFEPCYMPIPGIAGVFDQRRSRVIALISLIQLGYADGAYEIEERCVITEVANEFAISEAYLLRIENWVERLIALQAEAVDFL